MSEADPQGVLLWFVIMFGALIGCWLKMLASARWEDWLDERWGRGSVRDDWLLRRIQRDAEDQPPR